MKRMDRADVWRERVNAFAQSGLPIRKFCEGQGISTTTFYKWRRRLGTDGKGRVAPVLEFVEVGSGRKQPSVELVTKSGVVVRVGDNFDKSTLVRVLDVLRDRR